jgi:hypothetical protein
MTRARKLRLDPRGLPLMTEDAIQIALVAQLRAGCAPRAQFFHVPNGGHRAISTARRFKMLGVLPGVSDMIYLMPERRVFFHEIKADDGEWDAAQKAFCAAVRALGFDYHVSYGLDGALAFARSVGVLTTREAR